MRKLECNKEEMSKIVVDPLKIKEDKTDPTEDIGSPFFEGGRKEAAKITEIQKKKEKEDNELAKRKEEAYRAQKEEEKKAEEARITNLRKELEIQKRKQARLEEESRRLDLEIQKEKQAWLEEESRRLETIEGERRKKEKQKEETHRLQKEEKEKRRKEASKAQKEKTSIFYFGDLFQQRKAKNDLQTQEAEVGFYELDGHRVSLTNDQWIQIFIIKLLMCGIPLLAKFPPYHMRLFALANKDIYLSSHNHH